MRSAVLATLTLAGACAISARASAYHEPGSEWVRGSPYTLRAGELSLGIIDWDVGITDEITVGTHPVLWAGAPWFGNPVANAKLKVRDWFHDQFALSALSSFAYLDGGRLATNLISKDADASLFVLDIRTDGAWRSNPALTVGASFDFTYAKLSGSRGLNSALGNAVEDTLRLTAWAEWRASRVIALKLNGRLMLFDSPPTGRLQFQAAPAVAVDARVSFADVAPVGAWAVWPELELSWQHVNLMLGAGYGYLAVPIVDVTLDQRGLVLTGDFFVRFGG